MAVDLKRMSKNGAAHDVSYVWVAQRGRKSTGRVVSRKAEPDPMTVPWGDIVEVPLQFLRRIFSRD